MAELWERQPGETQRAYHCFSVFRDLGKTRTVLAAFRQETGKTEAKQAAGVWNAWVKQYEWRSRVNAYDDFCDRQLLEQKMEAKQQAHKEALEEFRMSHLQVARLTFANFGGVLKQLKQFIESNPKIENWDDAVKAGRVLALRDGSEMWADALGISTLLEQIDAQSED